MTCSYLLNNKFINSEEFKENLIKSIQGFDLFFEELKHNYLNSTSTNNFTSYDIADSSSLISLIAPCEKKFYRTKKNFIKGFGLISALSYSYDENVKNYLFPILYRLMQFYPKMIIINDSETQAYLRDENYEDGFKKYFLTDDYSLGKEMKDNFNIVSQVNIKGF